MLNQSFSNTNFEKIFYLENRKGNFHKNYYPDEYFKKHNDFLSVLKEKQELSKTASKDKLNILSQKLEKINKEKEEIRLLYFDKLSKIINLKSFQFNFQIIKQDKFDLFTIDKYSSNKEDIASSFFAIKQLQYNVFRTFKVKQSNRNDIIRQIYHLLSDNFPKIVIKTDIHSFYESIPHEKLMIKIYESQLLNTQSKNLIRKLFYEFESKKDISKIKPHHGIPRGLGISAYLSELFARDIDNEIKRLNDLVYYSRYVDDIVAIFIPQYLQSDPNLHFKKIKDIIEKRGLLLNDGQNKTENKTQTILLPDNKKIELTYLGYKFVKEQYNNNQKNYLKIELSEKKTRRIEERIRKAIDAYNLNSKYDEKSARRLLIDRLKFLTGNYHLKNNKKNIKAGIYYSNTLLTLGKKNSLIHLNNKLKKYLKKIAPYHKLKIDKAKLEDYILNKINFLDGFESKKFYNFKMTKKEKVFYKSKFRRNISKFEIIKMIWKDEK